MRAAAGAPLPSARWPWADRDTGRQEPAPLSTAPPPSPRPPWLRLGAGVLLVGAAVALFRHDPCADPRVSPNATSPYILPWPSGARRIHQGNCTTGNTHDKAHNASFAYDFAMPVGSPVVAARAGVVLSVEERWADTDHQEDHGNRLVLDHGDGTYAIYGHLTRGGAQVEVGERVAQGQLIALSGSSGLATTPHLHFMVLSCPLQVGGWRGLCASEPIRFRDGPPGAVAEGDWLGGG